MGGGERKSAAEEIERSCWPHLTYSTIQHNSQLISHMDNNLQQIV